MKIQSCNFFLPRPLYGILPAVFMALTVGLIWAPVHIFPVWAAETVEKKQQGPIEITADELVTDNEARSAVFSGNVTATQGDTKLTADRLAIFYKSQKGGDISTGESDIERLEARGHVRIMFDNRLAVSNQAVYIIEERKLVLEGPGSKIVSGKDEITGTRITFYRNEGRMALEGDDDNQVKAVIHSDQRGLN